MNPKPLGVIFIPSPQRRTEYVEPLSRRGQEQFTKAAEALGGLAAIDTEKTAEGREFWATLWKRVDQIAKGKLR